MDVLFGLGIALTVKRQRQSSLLVERGCMIDLRASLDGGELRQGLATVVLLLKGNDGPPALDLYFCKIHLIEESGMFVEGTFFMR